MPGFEVMRVVDATEDDIPRILEIERESISPPWTHGSLLGEIYREDSFFAVAYGTHGTRDIEISDQSVRAGCIDARDVLGFVILRRTGDEGELLQIAVDSAVRSCGVGDILIAAALQFATEHALMSVFLEVRESNEAAIGLYKKHGFQPVRRRKDYYIEPVEDAVVMVKGSTA